MSYQNLNCIHRKKKKVSPPPSSPSTLGSCAQKGALSLLIAGLATPSLAMPRFNSRQVNLSRLEAEAIANDPRLKGSSILGDDVSNTLYVSPSQKNASVSGFEVMGSFACDVNENQWKITYNFPRELTAEQILDLAKQGPFSPYFDHQYGLDIRNAVLTESLAKKIYEIENLKSSHPDLVKEKESYEFQYTELKAEIDKINAKITSLQTGIDSASKLLGVASTAEKISAATAALEAASESFDKEAPRLYEKLAPLESQLADIRVKYADARARYVAAIPNLENIENEVSSLNKIYSNLKQSSAASWNLSRSLLAQIESAPVGKASAGYSVWADEEAALRTFVTKKPQDFWNGVWNRGNPTVVRLPIFDVKSSFTEALKSSATPPPPGLQTTGSNVSDVLGGVPLGAGMAPTVQSTAFYQNGGSSPIEFTTTTLQNDGQGQYSVLVTRGAYCQATRNVEVDRMLLGNGSNVRLPVQMYQNRQNNVLFQPVTISYKYAVRNDPSEVSCELEYDKFKEYINKKGNSGILFWRKSWSKSEYNEATEAGISCNVKATPSDGSTAAADLARLESIRQKFMAEIAAEFVLQLSNTASVSTNAATIPTTAAFNEAGTALQGLCGINPYCQVGSIILKNADSLFSQNGGATADSVKISGKLRRNYTEQLFTIVPGSTTINLTVSL